ncbi:hypothetical protein TNCV_4628431 [Trichonephila clavipes]|nr:hypothetical protein TNCV_4628431 [Trichonephila clavipes]
MAQKRKLDYYDDDFDFDTESLSSFESDEDFVHSISSSEDDTSDEENFSSVRQWCKIDSSSPAPRVDLVLLRTENKYSNGAAVKSNTTSNHDTRCRTSVVMHYPTVQQPLTTKSQISNLTIVNFHAEEGFVRKQNFVQLCCPCPPFIAPLAAQMPSNFTSGHQMIRKGLNLCAMVFMM